MTEPAMFASTKAVDAALTANCPTPASKLLLVILASYVDPHLQAFPSMATLKDRTGIRSERTLAAHVQALVKAGLLRVEQDHAHNGRQTSNVFTLLLAVQGCTPAPAMNKPRRTHPHSIRRPVDRPVQKGGKRGSITPQILRGHPADIAGTYPADSAPLEPIQINQEGERPGPAPVNNPDPSPWKGKRYAAPAAPVVNSQRGFAGIGGAGEGSAKLAESLRRLEAAAATGPARHRSAV